MTIDYSDALTGDSMIDDTTKALCEKFADVMHKMDFIPTWTPQVYGTAVHTAFGNAVRFAGLEGIGPKMSNRALAAVMASSIAFAPMWCAGTLRET